MSTMRCHNVMILKRLGAPLEADQPGRPVYGFSIDRSEPRLFISLNMNEPEMLTAAMHDPCALEALRVRQTVLMETDYGHTELREVQLIEEGGARILIVHPVKPEPPVPPKRIRPPLRAGWSSIPER